MAHLRDNVLNFLVLVLKTLSLGYFHAVPTVTELVTYAHTCIQYTIHAYALSHMHESTLIHTAPTSMCIGIHIHSQCTYIHRLYCTHKCVHMHTQHTHMLTQSTQVHTHVYTCRVHKNPQVRSYMQTHYAHVCAHVYTIHRYVAPRCISL